MKKIIYIILILFSAITCYCQDIESYKKNKSLTYDEVIAAYKNLDKQSDYANLTEVGKSDAGKPIYLFLISPDKTFDAPSLRKKNYCTLFINNGIHPGEPDGIDASINFAADILSGKIELPKHVVIAIIPIYNIDGSFIRGCCSRVNQNGPVEYGFRSNAQNLDLNRDFIKCDSENAKTFTKIFRQWDPDVFIDTHVSNGADYQHVMTIIASQKDKLNRYLSKYVQSRMLPELYSAMEKEKFPMCPYVNVWNGTPDKGFEGFLETPRFATGYSALFNTIGLVTETHMLKPYPQRVEATYAFIHATLKIVEKDYAEIKAARLKAKEETKTQKDFTLQWKVDTQNADSILFKGYEGKYMKSNVTGLDRLYYDKNLPYTKYVPYYNNFIPKLEVSRPFGYIIPQAWKHVIERLKMNLVEMQTIKHDTVLKLKCYYIDDYKSGNKPYEGHHLKAEVSKREIQQYIQVFKGDYIVLCNQDANRYIIETLEPQGVDSWFAWGFFDAVLQQKEWYSDYVFIDKAEELLNENPGLKEEFEAKKKSDPAFAKDSDAMLYWLYKHSPYYELSHNRYPVYRIEAENTIPRE